MTATILYVDHAPVYGGAEAVLLRLAARLDHTRYRPLVAVGPCAPMEEALRTMSIAYRVLPLQPLNRRDWRVAPAALASALALRRLARHERVALMHTNTLRAHLLGAVAAPLARRPLVWTLHDLTCPLRLFRVFSAVPDAIICVSRTILDAYAPLCAQPRKMRVVHNGVEPRQVSSERVAALRQALGATPGQPLVVVVGRLVRGKGQDVFVRAAARVAARHPAALFVVAGGASDDSGPTDQVVRFSALNAGGVQYEQELKARAAELGVAGRVRFTGFLPDPAALYAAAAVVTHPGTMPEGLPTVPIEAMAAGRPVVASDLSAVREIVEHNQTGLIVPCGDSDALAAGISRLLDEPERAAAMGAAGLQRVRLLFNLERQAAEVAAIYDSILSRRHAEPKA